VTLDETKALIAKIRAADAADSDEQFDGHAKELLFGIAINLARLADSAERKVDIVMMGVPTKGMDDA
jgi:hypothetical protein